ncbi:MAG: SnoaL-like domain-containing protein [Planctomycetota bacterium]
MDLITVGNRLVELCKHGQHKQAIEELYADVVDVHEAMDPARMPELPEGMYPNGKQTKDQLLKGSDAFFAMNEIHGGNTEGPFPHGDNQFICYMSLDCTPKAGPMAGQRMDMKEACVYTVEDGKITGSKFCYHFPGCE